MSHSNLTNTQSLHNANYFLLALICFSSITLLLALLMTAQGLSPIFGGIAWFTNTILKSTFFYSALCGTIFIYTYIYCWQQNHSWAFLIVGIVLAFCLIIGKLTHLIHVSSLANPIMLIIWLCCVASLLWQIAITPYERDLNLNLLLTIMLPILFLLLATFFLGLTIVFHPKTQDELLMAIDATLGFNPSFLAGQLFTYLPHTIVSLLRFIYLTLPFALAIIYVARYQHDHQPPLEFIIEFFLLGMVGMLLYHINTGCGPINAFKTIWPHRLPTVPLHPTLQLCTGTFLPRNCLPSLHTAWAICIWRHSLRCNYKIRIFIAIWVICTLISTLGLGEHYLVDLMVGFALATMLGGVCAINVSMRHPARKYAILLGGIICLSWYLLINFGLTLLRLSPYVACFFYLASMGMCGKLEFQLIRAQKLTA